MGLLDAYDLDQSELSHFGNLSTRGFVDTGDNVLIGGVIVGGAVASPEKVIVRAMGPSLATSGIQSPLQDPTLELRDGNGTLLAFNNDWKDSQQAEIVATGIPPTDDRESAIVYRLPQGPKTAIVRGKNNTVGVGLVEVYVVP
ncbi:MAG: hypothetical protein M3Z64_04360 [Verrucomicrobiota bacterium]|nr:hypothetical protein [Verrucomicrobiota bacterium]